MSDRHPAHCLPHTPGRGPAHPRQAARCPCLPQGMPHPHPHLDPHPQTRPQGQATHKRRRESTPLTNRPQRRPLGSGAADAKAQHLRRKRPHGWGSSDRRQELPPSWHQIRQRILRRDNYKCQINGPHCAGQATEVDHIVRGTNHEETNLQAACRPCHARKTSRELLDVQRRMRAQRLRPQERHPGKRC